MWLGAILLEYTIVDIVDEASLTYVVGLIVGMHDQLVDEGSQYIVSVVQYVPPIPLRCITQIQHGSHIYWCHLFPAEQFSSLRAAPHASGYQYFNLVEKTSGRGVTYEPPSPPQCC